MNTNFDSLLFRFSPPCTERGSEKSMTEYEIRVQRKKEEECTRKRQDFEIYRQKFQQILKENIISLSCFHFLIHIC